ncbi:MAG: ABC transporter ATP-binding protein, partial [Lachnospiraceae bacterium]|nr:ABC transporter ATP-binding protein [Lachnospiraceae bacterium]
MKEDRKFGVFQNIGYCIRAVKEVYPKLLLYCVIIIVLNSAIPLITTYLPKVMIEGITEGGELRHIVTVTGVMALILALLTALQKYMERMIYWHKFKVNAFFLRKVTKKGLTTDYKNQENEHFRKLQHESFASCNGNFSYFNQIMDASVSFFSNLLGFAAFFGILATLNPWFIVFLCATTWIGFLLNRKLNQWIAHNTEEKTGYEQRMQYVISVSDDRRSAKDIRLYDMAVWMDAVYQKNLRGVLGWYRRYTAKLFGVSSADSGVTLIREAVTYLFLIRMVFRDEITVAEFVLYFNIVAGFSAWLGNMLGQLSNIERLNMSVNRIRTYLEYPEEYKRGSGMSVPATDTPWEIQLDHLCFRYKEEDK